MIVPLGLMRTKKVPMIDATIETAPSAIGTPSEKAMPVSPNARMPMSIAATVVTT